MSLVQLQTKIPSVAVQQILFLKMSEEASRFCRTRREAIFTPGLNGMGLYLVFSATCWWLNFILSDEHFGEWFCDQEEPTFVFFRSWSRYFFKIFYAFFRWIVKESSFHTLYTLRLSSCQPKKNAFSSVLIMKKIWGAREINDERQRRTHTTWVVASAQEG